MQGLKEVVQKGDPGAIRMVRQAGSDVVPILRDLAGAKDPAVRTLALICLAETGGAPALKACRDALKDEHPQVRSAAVQGVERLYERGRPIQLLEAYDAVADGWARRRLALAFGRAAKPADAPELKKRLEKEQDPEAREGCLVTMARLEDKDARAEFAKKLKDSADPDTLERYLEYAEEIGAPWALKTLVPLLDRKVPATRIGADGRTDVPEYLRACDAAVLLTARLSGKRLTFRTAPSVQYTVAQIDEVRKILEALS